MKPNIDSISKRISIIKSFNLIKLSNKSSIILSKIVPLSNFYIILIKDCIIFLFCILLKIKIRSINSFLMFQVRKKVTFFKSRIISMILPSIKLILPGTLRFSLAITILCLGFIPLEKSHVIKLFS